MDNVPGLASEYTEQVGPQNPPFFLGYWYDEEKGKTVRRWMENRGGYAVIQGDMILGPVEKFSQAGSDKATFFTNSKQWTWAIVPFEIPDDFPEKKKVLAAVEEFNQKTEIQFRPRESGDKNWITFQLYPAPLPGKEDPFLNVGGDSQYGRRSSAGEQRVRLNRYGHFSTGTIIHELCHALGQGHEQNRQNRNDFVEIHKENIARDSHGDIPDVTAAQFDILNPGKDYNEIYDFDSISHYPQGAFAASGKATIVAKDSLAKGTYVGNPKKFGNKEHLSIGDIQGLNGVYHDQIEARKKQPH